MATYWTVPGRVVRVIDADTIMVKLDLGWRISYEAGVRIMGINAPELSTAVGKEARAFAISLLPVDLPVVVVSRQLDKYGRVLGSIAMPGGLDFAQALLNAGYAVRSP